ncbi:hypothetical protein [Pectobacterium aroidearum]|uniref:hypothetical protein n=1 Tax=Pectobacterium aroidearum TaxID=1201031 RepID=UPI003018B2D3
MSTEQMRSEFETWWAKNNCDVKTPMGILVKGIAEKAWRESRLALVVELPSRCECCYGDAEKEIFDSVTEICADAIRAAGITVRGE